jgi:hypothetical protein
MIDRKLVVRAQDRWPAAQKPVTMQGLWRLGLWGSTAACAMLVAALAGSGLIGSQRAVGALASFGAKSFGGNSVAVLQPDQGPPRPAGAAAPPSFDAQAETVRLTTAVKDLKTDDDELKTRLATIEHSIDDVTGSIAKQADSAKATPAPAAPAWPANGEPVATTPAEIAALVTPGLQPAPQYGVDLGSAASIPSLRARWIGIRALHARLFEGLTPTVALRDDAQPSRSELVLVLGPLPDVDAATRLCAALTTVRLACEPTVFSPQHLTLE